MLNLLAREGNKYYYCTLSWLALRRRLRVMQSIIKAGGARRLPCRRGASHVIAQDERTSQSQPRNPIHHKWLTWATLLFLTDGHWYEIDESFSPWRYKAPFRTGTKNARAAQASSPAICSHLARAYCSTGRSQLKKSQFIYCQLEFDSKIKK